MTTQPTPPASPAPPGRSSILFSTLLGLEKTARRAPDLEALRHAIVNDTRRLCPYRRAVLFDHGRSPVPVALSDLPTVDRAAPEVDWLTRVTRHLTKDEATAYPDIRPIEASDLPPDLARDWTTFGGGQALLCPLPDRDGLPRGWLWLGRSGAFDASERALLAHLTETHALCLRAMGGRAALPRRAPPRPWLIGGALALVVLVGLLPVPRTVLAPGQVAARDPITVAAPMDGVVEALAVTPNQTVAAGDLLLTLDDTEARAAVAVAERALDIAREEVRMARQGSFADRDAGARIAFLEAQANLRAAELDLARARLDRVQVRAERAGIVLFARADDWPGRPVRTGERVMTIADPEKAEIQVDLPVGEAIALPEGAEVRLFLDARPLDPLEGRLTRQSYEAAPTPDGTLAYDLRADLTGDAALEDQRIGLRGTARVRGDSVPLALFLLRRPLVALRQTIGF
jgi:multidrug efflux pump subunit AcrA (membrane-fusion protein)